MVPDKRTITAGCGLLASAALALAACAPFGYGENDASTDSTPATATGTPGPGNAPAAGNDTEVNLTTELKASTIKRMGKVVVNQDGFTLYLFTKDSKSPSKSTCDGTKQITIGGWPVYTYTGDKKPGAWKGQFVSGTWYVIGPNGKKNITCLPTITPKPVAPPAGDTGDGGSSGSDLGGGYSY